MYAPSRPIPGNRLTGNVPVTQLVSLLALVDAHGFHLTLVLLDLPVKDPATSHLLWQPYRLELAQPQQVSLKIYNLAGQRVATLVSEPLSAGTHSRVLDAAGLASGIYFYRLITERNVFTKKMTLIK